MNSTTKVIIAGAAVATLMSAAAFYMMQEKPQDATQVTAKAPTPVQSPAVASLPDISMQNKPSQTKAKKVETALPESDSEVLSLQDPNPNFATFKDRYNSILARRNGREYDADALYAAMQEPDAWKASEEAPEGYDLNEAEMNDGRQFVNVSNMKLESLAPGDTLDISIPNSDIDFKATITDVASSPDGSSITFNGTSNIEGSNDRITITKGDDLVVGGIFTETGLYQIEAKNGQGYIVSSATLFRHGQDQEVHVPQDLLDNPPDGYVKLDAETFGG